jgi:hypothetical protein
MLSSIIGVIFSILKFASNYNENPKPDFKESFFVFVSSMVGLYAYDNFILPDIKPKLSEIFTDPPPF